MEQFNRITKHGPVKQKVALGAIALLGVVVYYYLLQYLCPYFN